MGGIIDGCPSGYSIDLESIKHHLAKRQGGSPFTTARREPDEIELLSGLFQGKTTGAPIGFLIRNKAQRSEDYDKLADLYRAGHGDLNIAAKYGVYDYRGGGRFSARETVNWVVAGAIARQVLEQHLGTSISIDAVVESIGGKKDYAGLLEECKQSGDTLGGTIVCTITATDTSRLGGIGNPVFDKLNARLAHAMMSIPSACGFEMGSGFGSSNMRGSEYVDKFKTTTQSMMPYAQTITNHCGGVQAGISNGMPIEFRVAFHPIATMPQGTNCISSNGDVHTIQPGGRHDTCQVLRCPVIVESLAAHTLLDLVLSSTTN